MLESGSIIAGNYKIFEAIGSGGGGDIYKAEHMRLNKEVVLKRIKTQIVGKIEHRSEADIVKGLKHSYLPQIYDFISEDNGIFTVMDYIEGESLAVILKREGTLPQQRIIKYLTQLCEVVEYLHSRNPAIIHSDIKPANIMVTPDDNICLIDFNISLVFSGQERVPIGVTDGYAPPEQYSDQAMKAALNQKQKNQNQSDATIVDTELVRTLLDTEMSDMVPLAQGAKTVDDIRIDWISQTKVGPSLDIYGIGATAYHMVTGERPKCSLLGVKSIKDQKLRHIGPGLCYLVDHAMEKQPDNRFLSVSQMLHIIRNIKSFDNRYRRQRMMEVLSAGIIAAVLICSVVLIIAGIHKLQSENNQLYENYLQQVQKMISPEQRTEVEHLCEQAIELMPYRPDSYLAQAVYLYKIGAYDDCIDYVSHALNIIEPSEENQQKFGDLYYVLAECNLEQENYTEAIHCCQTAILYNPESSEYYRDYAIALSRSGDEVQAQKELENAVMLGLENDDINMVRGEIALGRQDFEKAEQYFNDAIQSAQNDDTKYYCVLLLSRMYTLASDKIENAQVKNIQLLEQYTNQAENQFQVQLKEELARAYASYGQTINDHTLYEKALALYEEIWNSGDKRWRISINRAVLNEQIGQFEEAKEILEELESLYPDNYIVFMHHAFLEANIQGQLANADRDYSQFDHYYQRAENIYQSNVVNKNDMEMQRLESLWQDIKAGGWI